MSKRPYAVPRWAWGTTNYGLVQPPDGLAEVGFDKEQEPPAPWFNYLFNAYGAWLGWLSAPDLANWRYREWNASPTAMTGILRIEVDSEVAIADFPDFDFLGRYLIAGTVGGAPSIRSSANGDDWEEFTNFPMGTTGSPSALVYDATGHRWWIAVDDSLGSLFWTPRAPLGSSAASSGSEEWTAETLPAATTGLRGIALGAGTREVAVISHDHIIITPNSASVALAVATHPSFTSGRDIVSTGASWLAVADDGAIYRATSITDSWGLVTTLTLTSGGEPRLAVGDGVVVVYCYDLAGDQSIWTSDDDGLTWTEVATIASRITRLRFGDGVWIASVSGGGTAIWQSNDLVAWTILSTTPEAVGTGDVVLGRGLWIATGDQWTIASGRARSGWSDAWQPDGTPQYLSDAGYLRGIRIDVTAPTDGQVLTYDAGSGTYVPTSPAATPSAPWSSASAPAAVQTTDATVTTLATIATTTDRGHLLRVEVLAVAHDLSAMVGWTYLVTVINDGGTVTISDTLQVGVTDPASAIVDGTAPVAFDVSGTSVRVRVKGDASTTVDWSAAATTLLGGS